MMVRVNLRRWMRRNSFAIYAYLALGLATLALVIHALGAIKTLVLIGIVSPFLVTALVRMREELHKCS